ncbi:twin-arginine translocation signal domain-containing protein [Patescibacteria group bacterium]|nr:twin-arginine translocation signal domain-containing protein [Patescibacteria group bacterium]MCL5091238.1 twin-arginine translocation signal domain-containing protein [Patescibacteria group bacterium]
MLYSIEEMTESTHTNAGALSRRGFIKAAAVLTGGSLLAACGGQAAPTPQAPRPSPEKPTPAPIAPATTENPQPAVTSSPTPAEAPLPNTEPIATTEQMQVFMQEAARFYAKVYYPGQPENTLQGVMDKRVQEMMREFTVQTINQKPQYQLERSTDAVPSQIGADPEAVAQLIKENRGRLVITWINVANSRSFVSNRWAIEPLSDRITDQSRKARSGDMQLTQFDPDTGHVSLLDINSLRNAVLALHPNFPNQTTEDQREFSQNLVALSVEWPESNQPNNAPQPVFTVVFPNDIPKPNEAENTAGQLDKLLSFPDGDMIANAFNHGHSADDVIRAMLKTASEHPTSLWQIYPAWQNHPTN